LAVSASRMGQSVDNSSCRARAEFLYEHSVERLDTAGGAIQSIAVRALSAGGKAGILRDPSKYSRLTT